jgi:hypothetical protein
MDVLFKERSEEAMQSWNRVRDFQGLDKVDTLQWWEMLVKPGIKKIGIQRAKEISKERREELNLLLLRQVYLVKKVQLGQVGRLGELRTVHLLMEKWYIKVIRYSTNQELGNSKRVRRPLSIIMNSIRKQ